MHRSFPPGRRFKVKSSKERHSIRKVSQSSLDVHSLFPQKGDMAGAMNGKRWSALKMTSLEGGNKVTLAHFSGVRGGHITKVYSQAKTRQLHCASEMGTEEPRKRGDIISYRHQGVIEDTRWEI